LLLSTGLQVPPLFDTIKEPLLPDGENANLSVTIYDLMHIPTPSHDGSVSILKANLHFVYFYKAIFDVILGSSNANLYPAAPCYLITFGFTIVIFKCLHCLKT